MSPEQLLGREVSVRSDIYALGLVIYELVTGRRAFEGKGFAELARKHRDERPIEPSALRARPRPGGRAHDPRLPREGAAQASALGARRRRDAAGPRPARGRDRRRRDAVARARRRGRRDEGLRPAGGLGVPGRRGAGVLAFPALAGAAPPAERACRREEPGDARGPRPRPAGAVRAGRSPSTPRSASATTWTTCAGPPSATARDRWDLARDRRAAAVRFWYRQSPRPLDGQTSAGAWPGTTPIQLAGMAGASYDFRGRLLSFYVVPPQLERAAAATRRRAAAEPDWALLFGEARLDPLAFQRVSRSGRRRSTSTRASPGKAAGRLGPSSRCASRPRATAAGRSGSS